MYVPIPPWLLATMWVLGIEAGSAGRVVITQWSSEPLHINEHVLLTILYSSLELQPSPQEPTHAILPIRLLPEIPWATHTQHCALVPISTCTRLAKLPHLCAHVPEVNYRRGTDLGVWIQQSQSRTEGRAWWHSLCNNKKPERMHLLFFSLPAFSPAYETETDIHIQTSLAHLVNPP